jgi:transcriptional regulator with GAF, ATPase, and Fis domain
MLLSNMRTLYELCSDNASQAPLPASRDNRRRRSVELTAGCRKAARTLDITPRQIGYALRKYRTEMKRF